MQKKLILGLIENIKINGIQVEAKIDTGADKSSICNSLVDKLKLVPTGKMILVRSSHGSTKRKIYMADIELKGKKFNSEFTVTDRAHLNFDVLIGRNILKKGFLIDPTK